MTKVFYYSIFIISWLCAMPASAQNMLGLGLNNHSGIHGVYLNPARLANHPQRFSINVGTFGAHLGNNYALYRAPFTLLSLATGNVPNTYDDSEGKLMFLPEYLERVAGDEKKSGSFSLDARGPSAMLSLRDGSGIALSTRVRTAFQVSNASSEFVTLVRFGLDNPILWSSGTNYDNKFAINNNSYAELAASYGREIWNDGPHRLNAGVTAKYLSGWYSSHLINEGMKYRVTEIASGGGLSGQIQIDQLRGSMGYVGGQKVFDQIGRGKIPTERPGHGFGADLGLVYEFRPTDSGSRAQRYGWDEEYYKLRVSVSVLDLGLIRFKRAGIIRSYDLAVDNERINFKDFKQDQLLDNAFTLIENRLELDPAQADEQFKTGLPTALQLHADWHVRGLFFLGLSSMSNLRAADAITMWQPSYVALTPRLERHNGSVAVPLVAIDGTVVPGLALRIGPVSIGSDNLPGLFGKKDGFQPRGADIYAGLSFSGTTKTRRRTPDGVYDDDRSTAPAAVPLPTTRRNPGIEVQYPNDGLARLIEQALDSKARGKSWLAPADAVLEELAVRLRTNPQWRVTFSFVAAGPNADKVASRQEALVNYLTQQGVPQPQRTVVAAIPPSEDFAGPVRVRIGE